MDIWRRQKGEDGRVETVKKTEVKDLWTFSSLEALPPSEIEAAAIFDKVSEPENDRGENASSFDYKCLECHSNLHHNHRKICASGAVKSQESKLSCSGSENIVLTF